MGYRSFNGFSWIIWAKMRCMIKIKIIEIGGGRRLEESLGKKKFEKYRINLIEPLKEDERINEVIIEVYSKSVLMTIFRAYKFTSRLDVSECYCHLLFCPHFLSLFQGEILIFKVLLIRIENRDISNLNSVPINIKCCIFRLTRSLSYALYLFHEFECIISHGELGIYSKTFPYFVKFILLVYEKIVGVHYKLLFIVSLFIEKFKEYG